MSTWRSMKNRYLSREVWHKKSFADRIKYIVNRWICTRKETAGGKPVLRSRKRREALRDATRKLMIEEECDSIQSNKT